MESPWRYYDDGLCDPLERGDYEWLHKIRVADDGCQRLLRSDVPVDVLATLGSYRLVELIAHGIDPWSLRVTDEGRMWLESVNGETRAPAIAGWPTWSDAELRQLAGRWEDSSAAAKMRELIERLRNHRPVRPE